MKGWKLFFTVAGIALAMDVLGQGVAAIIRRKLPARVKQALYPDRDRPGDPTDTGGEMSI